MLSLALAAPNKAVEPTPTASARASLRLLARLTAGVRCGRLLWSWEGKLEVEESA